MKLHLVEIYASQAYFCMNCSGIWKSKFTWRNFNSNFGKRNSLPATNIPKFDLWDILVLCDIVHYVEYFVEKIALNDLWWHAQLVAICQKSMTTAAKRLLLIYQLPSCFHIKGPIFVAFVAHIFLATLPLLILTPWKWDSSCNCCYSYQKKRIIVLSHVMVLARVMVSDTGSIKSILFISKSSLVNFIFV